LDRGKRLISLREAVSATNGKDTEMKPGRRKHVYEVGACCSAFSNPGSDVDGVAPAELARKLLVFRRQPCYDLSLV
jgi:hypothetical protein